MRDGMGPLAGMLLLTLAGCAGDRPDATPAAAPVATPPPPAAAPGPRPARRPGPDRPVLYRVAADATTGCADRAVLQRLREAGQTGALPPRQLAALRAAGGCATAFPALAWRLVEQTPEALRLEPAAPGGPATGPLWFWRDELVEERAGA